MEADETYFGDKPETKGRSKKQGFGHKRAIVGLVERGGEVRTFHVPAAHVDNVHGIVMANIARESRLHTDESRLYLALAAPLRRMKPSSTVTMNMYAAT